MLSEDPRSHLNQDLAWPSPRNRSIIICAFVLTTFALLIVMFSSPTSSISSRRGIEDSMRCSAAQAKITLETAGYILVKDNLYYGTKTYCNCSQHSRDNCKSPPPSQTQVADNALYKTASDAPVCAPASSSQDKVLDYIQRWPYAAQAIPRILCIAYTVDKEDKREQVRSMKDTWMKRCNKLIIYSNVEDAELGTITISYEGPEHHNNLWSKVLSIFHQNYAPYRHYFDWFLLVGDDTYVIMDNLCMYLTSAPVIESHMAGEPVYLGRRFRLPNNGVIYPSGGPGYILNGAAYDAFMVATGAMSAQEANVPFLMGVSMKPSNDACPYSPTHRLNKPDDVYVSSCLYSVAVYLWDSRDPKGSERFHVYDPVTTLHREKIDDWYLWYSIELKYGWDIISPWSISFHYVPANQMREMENRMYKCRKTQEMMAKGLQRLGQHPTAARDYVFADQVTLNMRD